MLEAKLDDDPKNFEIKRNTNFYYVSTWFDPFSKNTVHRNEVEFYFLTL